MPNGIIKMLYSGKEDKQFTKNPDINFFKSVYKSYSNFVKVPENIQIEALRKIKGLENVKLFRAGYAIEYDYFPPTQLKTTLETKIIKLTQIKTMKQRINFSYKDIRSIGSDIRITLESI